MRIGIGYREPLARWIDQAPAEIECLEITAEHFFDGGTGRLETLRQRYPLLVHGLGLSLATPGPLHADTLERFARVCAAAEPLWISEHVAFTRTPEVDLGHLNPICPDESTLQIMADHAQEVSERCGRSLVLENVTTHLRVPGTMSETEFLNRLCETADCGLLVDVTNLFINSRNHDFDPLTWIREIEPRRIVQLHVVGYTRTAQRWEDLHGESIQSDLHALISAVMDYAPVQAVILERDRNFPAPETLSGELRQLGSLRVRH
jgi:uncharacterized protein